MKKLKAINVNDGIGFAYNYEVLNACFGTNMRASWRNATWDSRDGCLVWFPHKAKFVNGRYIAGSSEVNWKNYFEDNGETIVQMLYPGEQVDDNGKEPSYQKESTPLHTFMKMGEKDYRYVGTFLFDKNSSTTRFQVFRRIKDSINLSIWANGYDTDYFDENKIGKEAFRNLYIEKDFEKQKACIKKFFEANPNLEREEDYYNSARQEFLSKFGMATLIKMENSQYKSDYIPALASVLETLYEFRNSTQELYKALGEKDDFGRNLVSILQDKEFSVNDKIRKSPWGHQLTACIYTLYDKDGLELLYSINEEETNRMLHSLSINPAEDDDLVGKQSRLYFWRYCDNEIASWSSFRFYRFLCFMGGIKNRCVKYISKPKPDVAEQIQREAQNQEEEIEQADLCDAPKNYEYCGVPRAREINVNAKPSSGYIVPRHPDRKINALVRAGYLCEIDKSHATFLRRNTNKNYTETHHLIPLEFSGQFKYTLDTEENIVSLCSNCHNQIHYGQGAEALLRKLFEERKEALKRVGLGKTIDGIEVDYDQLLHMYGLD